MWFWNKEKPQLPAPSTRDPKDLQEQLGMLREVTRTTSILHEAQKLQLDNWAYVVLDNVVSHDMVLDLIGPRRSITYNLVVKGKKKTKDDLDRRLSYLDEWVKWLLGSDMTLRVRIGDVLVFEKGPSPVKT